MTMTKQEMFDRVWDHFVVQGNGPSRDVGSGCRYRSSNGNRCAIGLLIPDELYSSTMEGYPVAAVMRDFHEISGILGTEIGFLDSLQKVHDRSVLNRSVRDFYEEKYDFRAEMESRLRSLAEDFDLIVPTTTTEGDS